VVLGEKGATKFALMSGQRVHNVYDPTINLKLKRQIRHFLPIFSKVMVKNSPNSL
jgi:hypothetical protein